MHPSASHYIDSDLRNFKYSTKTRLCYNVTFFNLSPFRTQRYFIQKTEW